MQQNYLIISVINKPKKMLINLSYNIFEWVSTLQNIPDTDQTLGIKKGLEVGLLSSFRCPFSPENQFARELK
ncbi:MAG: hypothetical protein ACTSO9_05295 [Candidatus Helarchaeota archaeon]